MGETLTTQQVDDIAKSLSVRDQIDYKCFLRLQQLLPYVDTKDPLVRAAVKEAEELIRQRDQANHAYVTVLTRRN